MTEASLFDLALNTPESERAALLDRECCGDPALRARVESLLAAHQQPVSWLASDVTGPHLAGPLDSQENLASTVIAGRYKLLQQIGEGGMGSVWMADQTEPVKRRVAVKLIRAGSESKAILARFEAERQAIALMDHPNVARLLDAGTTESGQPFFVMELVKGMPITDFCDTQKLSIPERLRLLVQVCGAVQHAHQKGIIHRDLKPGNILVESHDGKPLVKVIDFGLAKATSGLALTEKTLFTAFGSVMGTPLYMAPEQARFDAVDVDTRADIYALGVILYELLTGSTPLDRTSVKKAAFEEVLRLIREEEPPTPSSRISTSEAKPTVAANRQTEPAKLGRFVKGELDWIVLKSLSKERARRYETANGFAKDIEAFLTQQPVLAGPPSATYRVRKFVQRNRGRVFAGLLVMVALCLGMVGTTLGLIEARDQASKADEEAGRAGRAEALAEKRADAEAVARAEATKEKTNALAQLDRAERLLYTSNLRNAERAWKDGDAKFAYKYLHGCRWDFRGWEHDYLYTTFNENHVTFRLNAEIQGIAVNPDGERLAALTYNPNVLHMWNLTTGDKILAQHTDHWCFGVAYHPGGKELMLQEWGAARFVDPETGKLLREVKLGNDKIRGLKYSPDGKWFASLDDNGKLILWDWANKTKAFEFPLDEKYKSADFAFHPNGKSLATVGHQLPVRIWDIASRKLISSLDTEWWGSEPKQMCWSADGKQIMWRNRVSNAPIAIVNLTPGQTIPPVDVRGEIQSFASSPDCQSSFYGTEDKIVCVSADGKQQPLIGHTGDVAHLLVTPNGTHVVSASEDRTIKVWNLSFWKSRIESSDASGSSGFKVTNWQHTIDIETIRPENGDPVVLKVPPYPTAAVFHSGGKEVLIGREDGTVSLIDVQTGKPRLSWKMGDKPIVKVWFESKPTDTSFAIDQDGHLKSWDSRTGKALLSKKHEDGLRDFYQSRDGTWAVAIAGSSAQIHDFVDKSMWYWNNSTPEARQQYSYSLAVSSDESLVAFGGTDGSIVVLSTRDWKPLSRMRVHRRPVDALAFSPDGKRLLSSSENGSVIFWDWANGQDLLRFPKAGLVNGGSFSPDGRQIEIQDKWTTLDGSTTQPRRALLGHENVITAGGISRDGAKYLTGSHDGTCRIWDARTGREVRSFRSLGTWIHNVHFINDDEQVLLRGYGVWILDPRGEQTHRQLKGYEEEGSGEDRPDPSALWLSEDQTVAVTAGAREYRFDERKKKAGIQDGYIAVWDLKTYEMPNKVTGLPDRVTSVSLSKDQTMLAGIMDLQDRTGKAIGKLTVWRLPERKVVCTIEDADLVSSQKTSISDDGSRIVTQNYTGIYTWDLRTGRKLSGQKLPFDHNLLASRGDISLRCSPVQDDWGHVFVVDAKAERRQLDYDRVRLKEWSKHQWQHEHMADEYEKANRPFAAAFHLRQHLKLSPSDEKARQRLSKLEARLQAEK